MTKRTKTPRRFAFPFRLRGILILAAIGVLFSAWITVQRQSQSSSYRSLEQIVGPSLRGGYEILESPDLPGPYRLLAEPIPVVGGGRGRVTAGGSTRMYDLPEQAGRVYLCVNLVTQDDRPTYAVLYKDLRRPVEPEGGPPDLPEKKGP